MEKQLLTSPEAETLTAIALVREDTWLGRSAWKDPGRPAASTLAPRQKLPYDCPLGIISGARGLAELLPHHHSFYIFIVSCQLFSNLVLQAEDDLNFFLPSFPLFVLWPLISHVLYYRNWVKIWRMICEEER